MCPQPYEKWKFINQQSRSRLQSKVGSFADTYFQLSQDRKTLIQIFTLLLSFSHAIMEVDVKLKSPEKVA